MKAKVFNEEKLIREKMKQQSLHYDNKVIFQFIVGREGTMNCKLFRWPKIYYHY